MDLIKKNIPIIICVVVAIAAIVADFYPLGGFREDLESKASARAAEYNNLNSILSKSRQLPIVDPTSTEPKPLEVFPTKAVIDMGKAVTDQFAGSSQTLLDNVVKRTQRQPLVAGALPSPQFVQSDAFKRAYQQITDMSPDGRRNSLPVKTMRAGFAPTSEDIQREAARITERIQQTRAIVANGQITNADAVKGAIDAELSVLQERMVREAAEKCLVYINPDTMDVMTQVIGATGQLEPSTIFLAQLGLWVQEDLFAGIRTVNELAGAKSVGQSPIKHLIKVDVLEEKFISGTPQSGDPNNPAPAPSSDPNSPIQPSFTTTPTGRVSNALFDVIHLKATMVIEADMLPAVLDQLGRGRLLTVIQVDRVEPVDRAVAENAGYFYGNKPCVRVELTIEDLLLRNWTEQYMPTRIKQLLGIAPPQPAS